MCYCFQGLLDDNEPSMDGGDPMPSLDKVVLWCLSYFVYCVVCCRLVTVIVL